MKVLLFFLYASLYLHRNKGIQLPKNVSIPAIIVFGDSIMDPGNNNYINTFIKANFPPYGKDFAGGKATGRFSNGKSLADFFAKALGVKEYLPAYLDPLLPEKDLQTGVSFASGGTGYDPLTATITSSISLSLQLEMFKQYIRKLKMSIGEEAANNIIRNSAYFVSASSNDFLMNYFNLPIRRLQYDVQGYNIMLVKLAETFIEDIHKLGARRIAVFSAPPIGCIPIERTLAGGPRRMCVEKYNKAAQMFNSMMKKHLQFLESSLPKSKLAFSDFYTPLISIIEHPKKYGLEVTDRGCCGTGDVEMSFLCNRLSQTCHNESKYFFWDSLHPTEKGCEIFVDLVLPDLVKELF